MQHSKPIFLQATTWHRAPGGEVRGNIQRLLVESEAHPKDVAAIFAHDYLQYLLTGMATLNANLSRAAQKAILKADPDALAPLPSSPLGHNYQVFLRPLYRGEQPAFFFTGARPQDLAFWKWLSEDADEEFDDLMEWVTANPIAAAEVLDDMRSSPKRAEIFSYEFAKRFAAAIESASTSKAA